MAAGSAVHIFAPTYVYKNLKCKGGKVNIRARLVHRLSKDVAHTNNAAELDGDTTIFISADSSSI